MFRKGSFTKEEEKRKKEVKAMMRQKLEEFKGFKSCNTSQALILAYLA